MITKGLFSSNTDMWATPQWLFDELDKEFHFTIDVCAIAENAKCKNYFSPEMDGLSKNWDRGVYWCNPPSSASWQGRAKYRSASTTRKAGKRLLKIKENKNGKIITTERKWRMGRSRLFRNKK